MNLVKVLFARPTWLFVIALVALIGRSPNHQGKLAIRPLTEWGITFTP